MIVLLKQCGRVRFKQRLYDYTINSFFPISKHPTSQTRPNEWHNHEYATMTSIYLFGLLQIQIICEAKHK